MNLESRPLESWFHRLDEIVEQARSEGRNHINYAEVMATLSLSSNYVRSLLKAYAYKRGYVYERGDLKFE